jgi:hypothetical protein
MHVRPFPISPRLAARESVETMRCVAIPVQHNSITSAFLRRRSCGLFHEQPIHKPVGVREMKRNWGIPTVTSGIASGGNHDPALRRADTLRDLNSLARHLPPGLAGPNLAVVRDSSFFQKHELNPVQRLNSKIEDREFACCVFWAVVITVVFGAPIAVAAAFMSWS